MASDGGEELFFLSLSSQHHSIVFSTAASIHSCLGMGWPGFSHNPEQEKSLAQLIDKRGSSEIGLPWTAGYVFTAFGPHTW